MIDGKDLRSFPAIPLDDEWEKHLETLEKTHGELAYPFVQMQLYISEIEDELDGSFVRGFLVGGFSFSLFWAILGLLYFLFS
jgi:hypothetical protein